MKKIQKVKVDFKLLLQFFMKLNQRTNKDSHLLFHIKKINKNFNSKLLYNFTEKNFK